MSSSNPAPRGEAIARQVRPLPSAPSLEYERKEAKALLKRIHAADSEALRRVQETHPVALRDHEPQAIKLADAQHVIAREYGFASWPRLIEYFEALERHRNAPRHNSDDAIDRFEEFAQGVVRRHQRGDRIVALELSHFVPRFFARPLAEILATPITQDEARLVVARERRRVSWDELIARAQDSRAWRERQRWEGKDTPHARAMMAIRSHDVATLATLLDEHPELLSPSVVEREWCSTLAGSALSLERGSIDVVQGALQFTPTQRASDARRVTDLLASRGVDIQRELDERLLGRPQDESMPHGGMQPETVRWYLNRGANPNWMPPNGISVLEHAIVRYKSSAAVDLIAERVSPRRALWISAGLGDVSGVRSFIAAKQRLAPEGRLNRPDLMAMGSIRWFPPNQDADDLEIMYEAFQIAGWNERWATMDALLDAGLPVDYTPTGWPLILDAVGNLIVPLAEYLIRRGADLDREWPGHGSARSMARSRVAHAHDPHNERARRMLAICSAGTVEEILANVDAKRQSPPPPEPRTLRAMQLAADDAARHGQSVVTTENMLVGFLRVNNGALAEVFAGSGADMGKVRAMIGARLLPDDDPLSGQELAADALAAAALGVAAAEADSRRRSSVAPAHLLVGILSQETGPAVQLLLQAGAITARLSERLQSML